MAEFNAEDILRKLRNGQSGETAPNTAAQRGSIIGAPSASALRSTNAGIQTSSSSSSTKVNGAQSRNMAVLDPAQTSTSFTTEPHERSRSSTKQNHLSSEFGHSFPGQSQVPVAPVSPIHRKEQLDIRETLERENAQLREELKKAKARVKELENENGTLSSDFRSYKSKKEALLAKDRGIIAQLTDKLNALTGEKNPQYSNNKPLSRPSPFKQPANTSKYLENSSSNKKQQKISEDVREKLEAMSASGSSKSFANPTWNDMMRRITPQDHDYNKSLRSGTPSAAPQSSSFSSSRRPEPSVPFKEAADSSMSMSIRSPSTPGSTPHHYSYNPFEQSQSSHLQSRHSFHASSSHHHHHDHAFSSTHRGTELYKDRRPGEHDDDTAVVDIDLTLRV